MKCGSLLGLFCRKPSPSTRLRRGPSSLQAQATAGSSAPAPCSAPCPDPRLGPSSAHLWLPAAGVVTGCGPSECLPLGTSSTIAVCRGASMVRGPHRECWLAQRCTQKSAERTVPLMIPAWGPRPSFPQGLGRNTPPRGSLRTFMHMAPCLLPPRDLWGSRAQTPELSRTS